MANTTHIPLSQRLKPSASQASVPQPHFFDLSQSEDQARLEELLDKYPYTRVIDTYEQQLLEYFVLNNPPLHLNRPERDKQFQPYRDKHHGNHESYEVGKWVYLPWRHTLLHILDDELYQVVRTGRNRNLITAEEQQKYYHCTIGIAGLSVGNSVALAIVQTGGGKHLKLADPDTLELTNLNRIRGSIAELTEPKVFMTARQIYELDPYAQLELLTNGLTEENIEEFFSRLDLVIDEIDQIGMKVRIRQEAKKRQLPVIMAADNGDGGVLDVERHDLSSNIEYFHGRAGSDIAERVIGQKLPLPVIGKIITEDLIGADVVTERMQKSLLEIGVTIPTWPQLGGAALLNGVAVAATARRILTGQPAIDNRAILSLESWLTPDYSSEAEIKKRQQMTKEFLSKFHEKFANKPEHTD